MKWRERDMPSLQGKVMIVTGGNSGLGYECVRALAQKGATVVMACRDVTKGELAKASIKDASGSIVVMPLNLQEPDSIRHFVALFMQTYQQLDVLLNNAGIMMSPYELTSSGVESQLATNHLGHFVLTALLLDVIKATPGARVVSVSSIAHRKGMIDFNDINYSQGATYDPMAAYRRSKLANLYFAYELDRFFRSRRIDAISVAAHPGVVPTNLMNHRFSSVKRALMLPFAKLFLQKVNVGALASLRAAVDVEVKGGSFYGPRRHNGWRGHPVLMFSSLVSYNADMSKKLWSFSEKRTGVRFSKR